MRTDHLAFRVKNRHKTAQFFIDAFGYKIQTEFNLDFGDGSTARCIALEPPEKTANNIPYTSWSEIQEIEYHLPYEIFVSDGSPDSIVGKWVEHRDNIGGLHHIALQVDSVEEKMKEWQNKGYAEFSSDEPMKCPGLTQVFTKPSMFTGVIYEFINRQEFGFCKENVKELMISTKDCQ